MYTDIIERFYNRTYISVYGRISTFDWAGGQVIVGVYPHIRHNTAVLINWLDIAQCSQRVGPKYPYVTHNWGQMTYFWQLLGMQIHASSLYRAHWEMGHVFTIVRIQSDVI